MADKLMTAEPPISKASLRQIFNDFAKKAATDFPSLQDRLLVYHYPTGEFFGAAATDGNEFTLDDKRSFLGQVNGRSRGHFKDEGILFDNSATNTAFTAEEWLRRARDGTYKPPLQFKMIVMGTVNPDRRLLSAAGSPVSDEIRNTMEHELGHRVVPGGSYSDKSKAQFGESAADAFSLIRYAQRGGNLGQVAETTAWKRNALFLLRNQTGHLTTQTVEGLKDLSQRQDLKQLTAVETANLAYRVARQYTPDPAEMEKVKEIFKPVSVAFKQGGMEAAMKATAEVMKQDHGALNEHVFSLGRNFLEPVLAEKMADTTMVVNKSTLRVGDTKLEGVYWDDMRKMIAQKSAAANAAKTTPAALLDQEARDMKLLGKFDKDPAHPIPREELGQYDASVSKAEESYKATRRAQGNAVSSSFLKTPKQAEASAIKLTPAENPLAGPETVHTKTRMGLKGGGIAAGVAMATVSGIAAAGTPDATPGKVADAALNTVVPGWTAAKKGDLCVAFGEVAGVIASGTAMVVSTPVVVSGALAVTAASGPAAPVIAPLAAAGATIVVAAVGAATYQAVAPGAEQLCKAATTINKPGVLKI